jgi:hypothetical protein
MSPKLLDVRIVAGVTPRAAMKISDLVLCDSADEASGLRVVRGHGGGGEGVAHDRLEHVVCVARRDAPPHHRRQARAERRLEEALADTQAHVSIIVRAGPV